MSKTEYVRLDDVLVCANDFCMFEEDDRNNFREMVKSECKIIKVDDNPKKSEGGEDRAKGEWIKEDNGKSTDIYRCSICGRSIMLCKDADLSKYPFCHCGADMRKGGKE